MSTDEERQRVERLNQVLESISIPITLHSSLDLTPSLLIAILESFLRERLPLSVEARESRTRAGRTEAMKWFLGVLGDDVLGRDLGEIDPRVLGEGGATQVREAADALLVAWESSSLDSAASSSSPPLVADDCDDEQTALGTEHSRTLASEGPTTADDEEALYELDDVNRDIARLLEERASLLEALK